MATIASSAESPLPLSRKPWHLLRRIQIERGTVFVMLFIGGLFAFELFNFSTTQFSLADLLGDLRFLGARWATILALAFCAIDFAGIARILGSNHRASQSLEVWYLRGAWFLAASMNALLTWWAVSLALISHSGLGNEILARDTLIHSVPVFVAILVWLIRILMIGTFTLAGHTPAGAGPKNGRPRSNVFASQQPAAEQPQPRRPVPSLHR
jgi:hypothetical protein